jgi:hypothetical protein
MGFMILAGTGKQAQAQGAIFVALNGNDYLGNGSINNPYRTLNKATDHAVPGDTIYVRGGIYTATKDSIYNVNGTACQPITISPYPNETVIFDGTGAAINSNSSVILISNSSYIIFKGFEIQNSAGRGLSTYEAHYVTIRDNRIHDIQGRGLGGGGTHLVFEENEVWNTVLENEDEAIPGSGWSAAVSTYYRANGAESNDIIIRNNHIYNSWGEGIIPIGATNVIIEGNTVHDTYSVNIYVSASHDISITRNYVYATTDTYNRSDHGYPANGIGLANENPTAANYLEDITIANNLIVGTGAGINYWQSPNPLPYNTYRNVKMFYNVIMDSHHTAILFDQINNPYWTPTGVELQNNIIYTGDNGTSLDIGNQTAWTISHNNWPGGVPAPATGSNNFSAPPQFVNPVIGGPVSGFKLQAGSSSIGQGTRVDIVTDHWGNLRGNSPTVGLHEFVPLTLDQKIYLPIIIRTGCLTQ